MLCFIDGGGANTAVASAFVQRHSPRTPIRAPCKLRHPRVHIGYHPLHHMMCGFVMANSPHPYHLRSVSAELCPELCTSLHLPLFPYFLLQHSCIPTFWGVARQLEMASARPVPAPGTHGVLHHVMCVTEMCVLHGVSNIGQALSRMTYTDTHQPPCTHHVTVSPPQGLTPYSFLLWRRRAALIPGTLGSLRNRGLRLR